MGDFNAEKQRSRVGRAASMKPPCDGTVGLARRASRVGFNVIFVDDTRRGLKIPQGQYLEEGAVPIIDQGDNEIAGYSNSYTGVYTDVPVVVFGDHTRIVKYVDRPFFIGADGVKILKVSDGVLPRYAFYALKAARIESLGYSRHFKLVKEQTFVLPPLPTQRQIAAVLDKICEMKRNAEARLQKLDLLVKARFVEMFGSGRQECPEVSLSEVGRISTGSTPSMKNRAYYASDDYCFVKPSDLSYEIAKFSDSECHISTKAASVARMFGKGTVLVTCIGATIGKIGIAQTKGTCNQQINFIETHDNIDSYYLAYAIQSRKDALVASANATAVPILNKSEFSKFKIPLPPLSLQRQFAAFVARVDALKATVQAALERTDLLYRAKLQEYFG